MVAQRKEIGTPLSADVEALLDQADEAPLVIVRNGVQYLVTRDGIPNPPRIADPEGRRRALLESVGALKGVDIEALKKDIRWWRGHDNDDSEA